MSEIVGHKTMSDGTHAPLSRREADAVLLLEKIALARTLGEKVSVLLAALDEARATELAHTRAALLATGAA